MLAVAVVSTLLTVRPLPWPSPKAVTSPPVMVGAEEDVGDARPRVTEDGAVRVNGVPFTVSTAVRSAPVDTVSETA